MVGAVWTTQIVITTSHAGRPTESLNRTLAHAAKGIAGPPRSRPAGHHPPAKVPQREEVAADKHILHRVALQQVGIDCHQLRQLGCCLRVLACYSAKALAGRADHLCNSRRISLGSMLLPNPVLQG